MCVCVLACLCSLSCNFQANERFCFPSRSGACARFDCDWNARVVFGALWMGSNFTGNTGTIACYAPFNQFGYLAFGGFHTTRFDLVLLNTRGRSTIRAAWHRFSHKRHVPTIKFTKWKLTFNRIIIFFSRSLNVNCKILLFVQQAPLQYHSVCLAQQCSL